ncbi:MAG: hypothetical protein VCB26_14565 [Candidatus Hydrogenedentota bacterium]
MVYDNYGTIGGGWENEAGDNDGSTTIFTYATVGVGFTNTARGKYAVVGGGDRGCLRSEWKDYIHWTF